VSGPRADGGCLGRPRGRSPATADRTGDGMETTGFLLQEVGPDPAAVFSLRQRVAGLHAGIRHFQFMLEGRQFILYTNHKPLTHALAKAV